MPENLSKLPFEERVRLARYIELNRVRPLLERTDQEDLLDDIVAKWGLDTQAGHEALLKPLYDTKAELEAKQEELLQSPYLIPERIMRSIAKWREDRRKNKLT